MSLSDHDHQTNHLDEPIHVPIMVDPIVNALVEPFLTLSGPSCFVDFTFGGGGHTRAVLKTLPEQHYVIAMDQDPSAVAAGEVGFRQEIASGRLKIYHSRFGEAESILRDQPIYGMLADLGFSSDQLENSERGLSFNSPGPLDMRLDPTRGISAYDFLNRISEKNLSEILQNYGEERFSKRIAAAILRARQTKELPKTAKGLSELILRVIPPAARHGRIHGATRTFQALRIAVNDELNELDQLLRHAILFLKPSGRMAVLSFHSLEDRKIKNLFRSEHFKALTKKPLEADNEELKHNPRARSAKLRVGEKIS